MNRRRYFLVALAVSLPLTMFGAAKIAASWRPQEVGSLPLVGTLVAGYPPTMRASNREIVFGNATTYSLFDLRSGESRALQVEGISTSGTAFWKMSGSRSSSLVITQENTRTRNYRVPPADFADIVATPREFMGEYLNVVANEKRIELLAGNRYYRWNAASGKLERAINYEYPDDIANAVLARDGEHIINAGEVEICSTSTRTGKIVKRVPVAPELLNAINPVISPLGNYAIYPVFSSGNPLSALAKWNFVSTANGRVIWNVQVGTNIDIVVFAPDERNVAIANLAGKVWEIRDLRTGEIIRTLPLVPQTGAAVFAPDGATLYSVANGVLHKQRAR